MKIIVPNKFSQNLYPILRRCGYMPIHDRISGQDSFSRKIATGHYPRFHLYLEDRVENVVFDLHLDQTETRYQGAKAHNADYDSPEVRNELGRLYQIILEYIK